MIGWVGFIVSIKHYRSLWKHQNAQISVFIDQLEISGFTMKSPKQWVERCIRVVEFGHGWRQVAGSHHVNATFDAQLGHVRMKRVRQQTASHHNVLLSLLEITAECPIMARFSCYGIPYFRFEIFFKVLVSVSVSLELHRHSRLTQVHLGNGR